MNKFIKKINDIVFATEMTVRALMITIFLSILPLGLTIYLVNTPIDYSVDDLSISNVRQVMYTLKSQQHMLIAPIIRLFAMERYLLEYIGILAMKNNNIPFKV